MAAFISSRINFQSYEYVEYNAPLRRTTKHSNERKRVTPPIKRSFPLRSIQHVDVALAFLKTLPGPLNCKIGEVCIS